jgi:hypothetical protein
MIFNVLLAALMIHHWIKILDIKAEIRKKWGGIQNHVDTLTEITKIVFRDIDVPFTEKY